MGRRRGEFSLTVTEIYQAKLEVCGACKAPILWYEGKRKRDGARYCMPLSVATRRDELGEPIAYFQSHFAACPDAVKFRRARGGRAG